MKSKIAYLFLGLACLGILIGLTAEHQYLMFKQLGFSAYDLGVQLHEIWKFHFGLEKFNSLRGIAVFGDHLWFGIIALKPVFSFSQPERVLFWLQSFFLYGGAFFLFYWTENFSKDRWRYFFVGILLFLNPILFHAALDALHVEVMGGLFLFAMLWAYFREKLGLSFAFALLAILSREDIALSVFAFALSIALFRKEKKWGLLLAIFSISYFVLCLKFILPHFNGSGFFRDQPGYVLSEVKRRAFDLKFYFEILSDSKNWKYLFLLTLPFLGMHKSLSFLILPFLAQTMVNILTRNPYHLAGVYHYDYQNLPFLFAALAQSISAFKTEQRTHWTLGFAGLTTLVLMYLHGAPAYKRVYNNFHSHSENSVFNHSRFLNLQQIDPQASVSVTHILAPVFAFREHVYFLPNPFERSYYGMGPEPFVQKMTDYIVLDQGDLESEKRLKPFRNSYEQISVENNLIFLRLKK